MSSHMGYYASSEPPIPWHPLDLGSKLIRFYDATDTSKFTLDGNWITQWRCSKTNAALTGGTNPVWYDIGNRVFFDGNESRWLQGSGMPTGTAANIDLYVKGGVHSDASDGFHCAVGFNSSSVPYNLYWVISTNVGGLLFANGVQTGTTRIGKTQNALLEGHYYSGAGNSWCKYTVWQSATLTIPSFNVSSSVYYLGRSRNDSSRYTARAYMIYFFICQNLTGTERNQLANWINTQ